jgi:hypothetical protein
MRNYGIIKFRKANVDNFTSNIGMNIRKIMNPMFRKLLKLGTKHKIVVDHYPKLEDNVPYIFVSTHGFVDDSVANLATIDRNAYLLFGTTDQLEVNPITYAAWANGFIYVDRGNKEHRKSAIDKMLRVLNHGNSVLIFPEGGFNNTENLLVQKLFASPYILARETSIKVVPIAPFYEFGSDTIYMNAGEPMDLSVYEDKKEALRDLRDALATLVYENIEKHSSRIVREELGYDPRLDFMEQRRLEYMKTKWTKDVWDEELTIYQDEADKEYKAVMESMDEVNVTKDNAEIMGPILALRYEQKRYDFKKYMKNNWNK